MKNPISCKSLFVLFFLIMSSVFCLNAQPVHNDSIPFVDILTLDLTYVKKGQYVVPVQPFDGITLIACIKKGRIVKFRARDSKNNKMLKVRKAAGPSNCIPDPSDCPVYLPPRCEYFTIGSQHFCSCSCGWIEDLPSYDDIW